MHRRTNSFKHIYTAKYLSYCTRSSSKYKQLATPSSTLKPLQTHRKLTYNTNPKLTNAHVKPYCIHKPLFLKPTRTAKYQRIRSMSRCKNHQFTAPTHKNQCKTHSNPCKTPMHTQTHVCKHIYTAKK